MTRGGVGRATPGTPDGPLTVRSGYDFAQLLCSACRVYVLEIRVTTPRTVGADPLVLDTVLCPICRANLDYSLAD